MTTTCRLVRIVGERYSQSAFWGEPGSCTTYGPNGTHFSTTDWPTYGIDHDWAPTPCSHCAKEYDGTAVRRSAGTHHVWSTESGHPEPGDMWLSGHGASGRCFHWDNCDGVHLHVCLPNGDSWDVDGRASNCDRRSDRTHRCWVRSGEPPKVTAGKAGNTCGAGAGSIQSGSYHGFLQDGVLT